ncbi:MAG: hypothetical protein M1825_005948 [Sarcosagium campestre]|nr:MAG: hypothetical protein M1825_005948 [Sarcosagium campestre]
MAPLPAISIASIIIGFISFSFTLFIFFNAFWAAFKTLGKAPTELRDVLATLRIELYEEKEHLRKARRHHATSGSVQANLDIGSLRVLNNTIKDLLREFKRLERPFLIESLGGGGGSSSGRRRRHATTDADSEPKVADDVVPQGYYRCDLAHRLVWLRSKNEVMDIGQRLERLQTRRIAREVTQSQMAIYEILRSVRGLDDGFAAIQDRLRRVRSVTLPRSRSRRRTKE